MAYDRRHGVGVGRRPNHRSGGHGRFRSALVAELRAALAGKVGPQQALERAARRWVELDQKRGLERHRTEYRISLGLLGR